MGRVGWLTNLFVTRRGFRRCPQEFLSTSTATPTQLQTAQATARIECDLAAGRPVEVLAATVLSGTGASDISWTPEDVVAGIKAQMSKTFGPNLLCDTAGCVVVTWTTFHSPVFHSTPAGEGRGGGSMASLTCACSLL